MFIELLGVSLVHGDGESRSEFGVTLSSLLVGFLSIQSFIAAQENNNFLGVGLK